MEAVSTEIVLPREAMGFGDVKFMAAIGAFLGWQATLFALVVSSFLGSAVGIVGMTMKGRKRFARIPYGPPSRRRRRSGSSAGGAASRIQTSAFRLQFLCQPRPVRGGKTPCTGRRVYYFSRPSPLPGE